MRFIPKSRMLWRLLLPKKSEKKSRKTDAGVGRIKGTPTLHAENAHSPIQNARETNVTSSAFRNFSLFLFSAIVCGICGDRKTERGKESVDGGLHFAPG